MSTPPDALATHLGHPVTARQLSDRRGSRAWEVTAGNGVHLALKANTPDAETSRDKAAEILREVNVLAALEQVGAVDPGYLHASGSWQGGRWIAVRWLGGRPLWHTWALTRGPEGDCPSVKPWLWNTARTLLGRLAATHGAGWAHADVQPTNTLVDAEDGTGHLIDYALACGPHDGERLPYRGALTHTTAPEIAAAILNTSGDTHIQATAEADMWSLGATLFWCWTGHRPVAYEDGTTRSEKLWAIAEGHTLPLHDVRPWPFPEFEHLITACMASAPEKRPTAAEAATW